MTRKDYILIANAIRATQARIRSQPDEDGFPTKSAELRGVRRAAAHLADALAQDNPRFDQQRFLSACGYGSTPASMLNRDINGDEKVERRPFTN